MQSVIKALWENPALIEGLLQNQDTQWFVIAAAAFLLGAVVRLLSLAEDKGQDREMTRHLAMALWIFCIPILLIATGWIWFLLFPFLLLLSLMGG